MKPVILLAAGGTGGHLFPAEALSYALQARGYEIDLATDTRALAYARHIPVRKIRVFAAATPHADTKWGRFCALFVLLWGTLQALWHLWRHRPR